MTIAGIAAPLLNAMGPEGAWEEFWDLRTVRRAIFRTLHLDERFVDHPSIRHAIQNTVKANNRTAKESRENAVTAGRRALLWAILGFVVLPWLPPQNHFANWLVLGVPLAFATRALTEQWWLLLIRGVPALAKRWET